MTGGKIHNYLGMVIDFGEVGKVKFTMTVESPSEELYATCEAATPAASHLFDINNDGMKLNDERAATFHQMTVKLLFLSKHARPDIQLPQWHSSAPRYNVLTRTIGRN